MIIQAQEAAALLHVGHRRSLYDRAVLKRLLFVCSRNRLRSPTAERVFGADPALQTDSAGLAPDADTILTAEHLAWADVVFVMEKAHRLRLTRLFGAQLRGKKVVCLDIPDKYEYMQPELVALLERKVRHHFRQTGHRP